MLEHIIDILAPHYCVGCKRSGSILCAGCSYLVTDQSPQCVCCQQPVAASWLCANCSKKYVVNNVWVCGVYDQQLKAALKAYKFSGARSAHRSLAALLNETTPLLDEASLVVGSVPTVPSHIRQRGYDHAGLLAKHLARVRQLPYASLLVRKTTDRQVGATRRQRHAQAIAAFGVKTGAPIPRAVLLFDDVITTGSTIEAAARQLKNAGVETVYAAAIAFEPYRR